MNTCNKTVKALTSSGDKSTQRRDIARAKEHWPDYRARKTNRV
ncbi:hypothetical protein [Salinisphaera sp. G21_0]|nr:hypothetical protein [Salinisphaera sp. G21_0]